MMQLSKNFWLSEFTKSDTAIRQGIDNSPEPEHLVALKHLCCAVLQPVRDALGPIKVTSGYRSLALNRAIGGSKTSHHMKGMAADIESPSLSNYDLAKWIEKNCKFTQVILEFYTQGVPSSGWVHVSYDPNDLKCQSLTFDGKVYKNGLLK